VALEPRITAVEDLLFRSPLVWIGHFRCPPDHPLFADSGPASAHLFVFPRTSVRIQHRDRQAFVTSRNLVTFYNPGDEYCRRPLDHEGDDCNWFAVAPELAAEVVRGCDPHAAERPETTFRFDHGPSDAASYYEHRLTLRRATDAGLADALLVEEAAMRLLACLVRNVYALRTGGAARSRSPRPLRPAQRDLVDAARRKLAENLADPQSLEGVARAVNSSAFNLCRLFKRGTGLSLHAYRNQLRLRRSLDLIEERSADLTSVALDLGYSSHSHFSHEFRRAFGWSPSNYRARARSGRATGDRKRAP
jgi:AraC-like DNA-binding protein